MKGIRWFAAATAISAVGLYSVGAWACDASKNTSAASAKRGSATAVTADMKSGSQKADCCAGQKGATKSAAMAAGASCASKGTSATTAVMASKGGSCSSHKGAANTTAVTAGAEGHCAPGAKTSAMAAGSGAHCGGKGMTAAAGGSSHADCDACVDLANCDSELKTAGAHTQVVPLKNGVMFVYTADAPGQVRAVQSAISRRGERITRFVSAGDQAHLCGDCKSMRGAMASGKLTREVVNIEGGSLTLMTSDDPAVVSKIHAMMDVKNSRSKS